MFFYIGTESPLNSLIKVNDSLYLDHGWHQIGDSWVKGYSTECVITSSVDLILEGYRPAGKWCLINDKKVYHPILRGFRLFSKGDELTNIPLEGWSPVALVEKKTISTREVITIDDASQRIGDFLVENTENFLRFNTPEILNIIITGGLDSATSWAILDNLTKNYSLNIYRGHPEKISFSEYNSALIEHVRKKYWSYNITRFYNRSNWLVTGFYAERFQLREVTTGDAIFKFLGVDPFSIVKKTDYLYWFLKRPRTIEIEEYDFSSVDELKDWCLDVVQYDYQGGHLDNNFQFSPFFDFRIAETVASLSLDDIILNLRNGVIQRKIIERFRPEFLCLLADYKNSLNTHANIKKNWPRIRLDSAVKIYNEYLL